MRYIFALTLTFLYFGSIAQQGEHIFDTGSSSGHWFRPFNDSLCLIHNEKGYYHLLNGITGEITVIDQGNHWGFSWVQHISPTEYIVCTHHGGQNGETELLLFSIDGSFRVLNHPGSEGTKVFYSKVFRDEESSFFIKGSSLLGYYNLVRIDSEFNPISEDTLMNSTNIPDDIGYPYYGNFNGKYFVFSGRNSSYFEEDDHNIYSIDIKTKEIENLTKWNNPGDGSSISRMTNIIEFQGDFYFQWYTHQEETSGFYISSGEYKGTEKLFFSFGHYAGGNLELTALNLPPNINGDVFINKADNFETNNCNDNLVRIGVDGFLEEFSVGVEFPGSRDVSFLGDSIVFIYNTDLCFNGNGNSQILELNLNSRKVNALDSIPENLLIGYDINHTWAMIEDNGSYENHHYYLFHKPSRSFYLFEDGITPTIGENTFYVDTPKPDNTYSKTVWVSNGYIYYSLYESIYRQPLPQVSSVREKKSQIAFEVYPNPTGKGYVEIKTSIRNGQFYWLNLQGQLVGSGSIKNTNPRIKTPKSPGLYLLQIADDNGGSLQRKVIVK